MTLKGSKQASRVTLEFALRPIPKRGHILRDKVDQKQMGGVEVIFLGENSPDSKA